MININFIIVKILLDISTSNPTEKFKDKRFIWSFDNCYMLLSNFLISIFNQIYKSRRYMVEEYATEGFTSARVTKRCDGGTGCCVH